MSVLSSFLCAYVIQLYTNYLGNRMFHRRSGGDGGRLSWVSNRWSSTCWVAHSGSRSSVQLENDASMERCDIVYGVFVLCACYINYSSSLYKCKLVVLFTNMSYN